MKVGLYQAVVFLGVGFTMASECIEIGATPTLHEALARTYHLKKEAVAMLTVATAVAQSLGMGAVGPVCDRWGRKWPVIICSLLITVAMVAMASLPEFPAIVSLCPDDVQQGGPQDVVENDADSSPPLYLPPVFPRDSGDNASNTSDTVLICANSTAEGFLTYPLRGRPLNEIMVLAMLFATRFLGGFAAGGVAAAGVVLAVESAPRYFRARLLFGIMFMTTFGFAISNFGLILFMPGLGAGEEDNWRRFSMWIGVFPAISTPFLAGVCESPYFLGIIGDVERLNRVMGYIKRVNTCSIRDDLAGGSPAIRIPKPRESSFDRGKETWLDLFRKIRLAIGMYYKVFMLLAAIQFSKSFFMAGHAYLLKDLFRAAHGGPGAAQLMTYASVAPMVGVALGERSLFLGTRMVLFWSTVIAAATLVITSFPMLRNDAWTLLALVILAKFSYGPMGSCVCIMSSEAFPTEVRGSNYAMLGMLHKVGSILAQSLTILLRGDRLTWDESTLISYILTLAVVALSAGIMGLLLPSDAVDGNALEDFVGQKRSLSDEVEMAQQESCRVSMFNIWHTDTRNSMYGGQRDSRATISA